MFSPYYRRAHRRQLGLPDDHCALNVALYSPGAARWTMTERARRHVVRDHDRFAIGPSSVQWRGDALRIDIDEVATPLPRRVHGRITVHPEALCDHVAALDGRARHRWGPIAPCARVEVALDTPALAWKGHAYVDSNEGDEPVTEGFVGWDWQRATFADRSTAVIYDVRQTGGRGERLIATRFGRDGEGRDIDAPARQRLPGTGWRIARHVRSESPPCAGRLLEDTPFYARSMLDCRLLGQSVHAVHETLDLRRFAAPWVQALLPFRMPRRS